MMRITSTLLFACAAFVAGCAWGEGSPDDDQQVDAAVAAAVCGDGVCGASEVASCASDCGGGGANNPVCGNNMCETGETNASCPNDCTGGGGGSGSGSGSAATCPSDPLACFGCLIDMSLCPAGHDQNSCTACIGVPPI